MIVKKDVKKDLDLDFGKIGGTAISAIVGLNPWETALSTYLKIRGEVGATPDNVAMARGRRYEPVVASIFQAGHPEFRVECNRRKTDEPELYVHGEHEFLIGRPDRLLYDSSGEKLLAGLEIKTANVANMRVWGAQGRRRPETLLAAMSMVRGTCGPRRLAFGGRFSRFGRRDENLSRVSNRFRR